MFTTYAEYVREDGSAVVLGHQAEQKYATAGFVIMLRSRNGIMALVRKFESEAEFILAMNDLTAHVDLDTVRGKDYASIAFRQSIVDSQILVEAA